MLHKLGHRCELETMKKYLNLFAANYHFKNFAIKEPPEPVSDLYEDESKGG